MRDSQGLSMKRALNMCTAVKCSAELLLCSHATKGQDAAHEILQTPASRKGEKQRKEDLASLPENVR